MKCNYTSPDIGVANITGELISFCTAGSTPKAIIADDFGNLHVCQVERVKIIRDAPAPADVAPNLEEIVAAAKARLESELAAEDLERQTAAEIALAQCVKERDRALFELARIALIYEMEVYHPTTEPRFHYGTVTIDVQDKLMGDIVRTLGCDRLSQVIDRYPHAKSNSVARSEIDKARTEWEARENAIQGDVNVVTAIRTFVEAMRKCTGFHAVQEIELHPTVALSGMGIAPQSARTVHRVTIKSGKD